MGDVAPIFPRKGVRARARERRGKEAWSISSPDHRHLRPSWQECTPSTVGGGGAKMRGSERGGRKQADMKRGSGVGGAKRK